MAEIAQDPPKASGISKAPKPPTAISGTGDWAPAKPKPVELPTNFPPHFPSSLALRARVILADTAKRFPHRSKLDQFCKELVSKLTDLLCIGIQTEVLRAHAAPDELKELLHYVLVANCDRENERFEIQRGIINSGEWHVMLKSLLECEENLEKASPKVDDLEEKDGNAPRQRIETFIVEMLDEATSTTQRSGLGLGGTQAGSFKTPIAQPEEAAKPITTGTDATQAAERGDHPNFVRGSGTGVTNGRTIVHLQSNR